MTEVTMRYKPTGLSTNSHRLARGKANLRTPRRRQPSSDAENRAHTAEALLDANGTASILLDVTGRVVYMNRPAEILALEEDGFRMLGDRISPTDSTKRATFQALIASAADQRSLGGAIALSRLSEKRSLQVVVTPFPHDGSFRSTARVLIQAADPERAAKFPDTILRALYDLTPAETEIANGLLTGFSLEEVATLRRTSLTTVRAQMKTLLSKTDTRRQGELIWLLSSLPRTAIDPWTGPVSRDSGYRPEHAAT